MKKSIVAACCLVLVVAVSGCHCCQCNGHPVDNAAGDLVDGFAQISAIQRPWHKKGPFCVPPWFGSR